MDILRGQGHLGVVDDVDIGEVVVVVVVIVVVGVVVVVVVVVILDP